MNFSSALISWQKQNGRQDLPWQASDDPYRVWLSEIMLQQTQVSTVIPYYERFLSVFPNLENLANAQLDEVLSLWSGLGYYSRARNLHLTAKILLERGFPENPEELAKLPGIGRSTAAAICAFSFGVRAAILDGNVKRVFSRYFGMEGHPGERKVEDRMWEKAEALLPENEIGRYTQGLMDLGATLCTRRNPGCLNCPLKESCVAHLEGRVDELPPPRPKKTLPCRRTAFLLVEREGRLLFERRPAKGIWGGLLCFPEADPAEFAESEKIFSFLHTFTHFRLEIEAVRIHRDREGTWLSIEEALCSPIPIPVRKILEKIREPSP